MKAYHGSEEIKEKYVERMREHMRLDHLVQGIGWASEVGATKGCAVGCTLDRYNHAAYETELGIPKWLAHVEDGIFERLNWEDAKSFPLDFLEAINVSSNLENIKIPFLVIICELVLESVDSREHPKQRNAIEQIITLLKKDPGTAEALKAAMVEAVEAERGTLPPGVIGTVQAAAEAAFAPGSKTIPIPAAVHFGVTDAVWQAANAIASAASGGVLYDLKHTKFRREAYKYLADKLLELIRAEEAPKKKRWRVYLTREEMTEAFWQLVEASGFRIAVGEEEKVIRLGSGAKTTVLERTVKLIKEGENDEEKTK